MEIAIIDEKNGNPFEYFPEEKDKYCSKNLHFPRSYKKQEIVNKVIEGLSRIMGLGNKIDCLEVGAGHNFIPAEAFSFLGNKVITLDNDLNYMRHYYLLKGNEFEDYERFNKLYAKSRIIPKLGGKLENVDCYLGDLAFIDHEESELNDKKFDLVYFFGSIYTDGTCSSIDCSESTLDLGIKIDFKERINKSLKCLKQEGKIFFCKSYFSGYLSESVNSLGIHNQSFVDLALYLSSIEKPAKEIKIFTQSPEALKRLHDIQCFSNKLNLRLIENQFESLLKSKYGQLLDKEKFVQIYESMNGEKEKFENLGLIDAISIEF